MHRSWSCVILPQCVPASFLDTLRHRVEYGLLIVDLGQLNVEISTDVGFKCWDGTFQPTAAGK